MTMYQKVPLALCGICGSAAGPARAVMPTAAWWQDVGNLAVVQGRSRVFTVTQYNCS